MTMAQHLVYKDLLACIQRDKCGLFSICSYSIIFDEPCLQTNTREGYMIKNCTNEKTSDNDNNRGDVYGINESLLEGNIMLLKNGLDHIVDYTWNVIGYTHDLKNDDVTSRKYILTPYSYAYFDTGIPVHHTVRLINNGETIDTTTSSKRQCTKHEACQYLLRACQSSLVFINTISMNPKINCMMYAKACGYFIHLADFYEQSGTSDDGSGGDETMSDDEQSFDVPSDNNNGNPNDEGDTQNNKNGKTKMDIYREGSSQCAIECLWSWYPSKWLPPTRSILSKFIDSLDMIRRAHLGLSMNSRTCKEDVIFTNDKYDIFHTTMDDELMLMMNRGDGGNGGGSGRPVENIAIIVWLSFFLILVGVISIFLALHVYYIKYYKEGKNLFNCGGVSSSGNSKGKPLSLSMNNHSAVLSDIDDSILI